MLAVVTESRYRFSRQVKGGGGPWLPERGAPVPQPSAPSGAELRSLGTRKEDGKWRRMRQDGTCRTEGGLGGHPQRGSWTRVPEVATPGGVAAILLLPNV